MPVITELRVSISRTLDLGNYNSAKIETSATVTRNSDQDTIENMRELLFLELYETLRFSLIDNVPAWKLRELIKKGDPIIKEPENPYVNLMVSRPEE